MKNFTAKQEILALKITYCIRVKVIFYLLLLGFCLKAYSIYFYFTKKASNQRSALANKQCLVNISKYINMLEDNKRTALNILRSAFPRKDQFLIWEQVRNLPCSSSLEGDLDKITMQHNLKAKITE